MEPTEDWVAQHFVFMWRLAEERVGDGARRVREAGQVRSSCQGIYCQGMGPRTWRTHKTFTTTFWVSEFSVQGIVISRHVSQNVHAPQVTETLLNVMFLNNYQPL